jgi:metal-dependent HD superfamily phosphatase/phosphodiesterase
MYASRTSVRVESSRGQIEALAHKAGATSFASGFDTLSGRARIEFEVKNRRVRFELTIKPAASDQFRRSRWRALYLVIKAKLESYESGIETFDEAFLAHVVMADGRRFGEVVIPQLDYTPVD